MSHPLHTHSLSLFALVGISSPSCSQLPGTDLPIIAANMHTAPKVLMGITDFVISAISPQTVSGKPTENVVGLMSSY